MGKRTEETTSDCLVSAAVNVGNQTRKLRKEEGGRMIRLRTGEGRKRNECLHRGNRELEVNWNEDESVETHRVEK